MGWTFHLLCSIVTCAFFAFYLLYLFHYICYLLYLLLFSDLYPLVPKRNLSGLTPSDRVRPYSTTQVEEIKTPRISKSDVLGKKGLVQRLSMGFEQLEQHAKDTQIQLGAEGRYVYSCMILLPVS